MSASFEDLVGFLEPTELDIRRAALRDLQLEQAEKLRTSGILTRAVFAAEQNGMFIHQESVHWACVYKHWNVYGVRFVSQYPDVMDDLPPSIIDVPVYEVAEGRTEPMHPFDEAEMAEVAAMVLALEMEKDFGAFPDMTPDLTGLVEPTPAVDAL